MAHGPPINRLTPTQVERLLSDYDGLPTTKSGTKRRDTLADLARHWDVSRGYIRQLARRRRGEQCRV